MPGTLKLAADEKAILGEGPCWDEREQQLYWIDSLGNKIYRYDPKTGENKSVNVPENIGCIALREQGGLIGALQSGFYFIDPNTGDCEFISDPEKHLPNNRFNDGKCDCTGHFWAGTMSTAENEGRGYSAPQGSLYLLSTDFNVRKMVESVTISNGIAWSPDNKTMYFIDSPTKRVVAFDFDADTGNIANRRTVILIPDNEGIPDGMTADAEGMLWIAQWGGWKVSRWDPRNGQRLLELGVPVRNVTSCVFGGENLDVLYITTSGMNAECGKNSEQPHAGGLFMIETGVKGRTMFRFRG